MSVSLNLGNWNSIFAVPSSVVDNHIKLAGSAQLKVLLFVLRHAGDRLSIDSIAQAISMHSADVKDALQYWVETSVISYQLDEIQPGCGSGVPEHQENTCPAGSLNLPRVHTDGKPESAPEKTPRLLSRPEKPDSLFVSKRVNDSAEIASLMSEAEVILGRLLSNADTSTLLMLHETDGLPVDVLIMLMQYAVSTGKRNMRYIEKMAISWGMEEIDSLAKAEAKIRSLEQNRKCWTTVERILGIEHRSPTAKEEEASVRWLEDLKMPQELIKEAYDRCINSQGKYILSYMDSILRRFHSSSIKTVAQANEPKSAVRTGKSTPSTTPSYNIEEYELFDRFA